MKFNSTVIPLALLTIGLLMVTQSSWNGRKMYYVSPALAAPHFSLWRVDSAHLVDDTKGTAIFWPCDSSYYFHFHPNTNEDIITEIKNDGDAALVLHLPLALTSGSFGPISIIEQPAKSTLNPGEETHFIIRHTGGLKYVHSLAAVSINDCKINFEVGSSCLFGGNSGTDNDGDGYCSDVDCDDNDDQINPGAQEICDGVDNNCDGNIDENLLELLYVDSDGDTYGDQNDPGALLCPEPGLVSNNNDCDDADFDVNPDAQEICDGVDNNCDGNIDENLLELLYVDSDGDTYGDQNDPGALLCPGPGLVSNNNDCDDADFDVNPDAQEICDGVDNNCDGNIDENLLELLYVDSDGDTYGDQNDPGALLCPEPGLVSNNNDCDDADFDVNPDAHEICNGIDDDCNGLTDDDDPNVTGGSTWYADTDGDGYGDPFSTMDACLQPSGFVSDDSDCNDNDGDINPLTEWYIDSDGDFFYSSMVTICDQPPGGILFSDILGVDCDDNDPSINPDALETCNGIDDNCDGNIDEGLGELYYEDNDGDNYYDPNIFKDTCSPPAGFILVADALGIDCNDANSALTTNCAMMVVSVAYVDSAATGNNDGSSWANAFTSLQDALTQCIADTIKVTRGTYYPDDGIGQTDNDINSTFNIPDSTVMIGGYESGGSFTQNLQCNPTILCGDIDQNSILDGGNAEHVVITRNVTNATVVNGFIISQGFAFNNPRGGGWYNDGSGPGHSSNPIMINCIIRNNYARVAGAGIYNDGNNFGFADPLIQNCIVSGNFCATNGGGINNFGSNSGHASPVLINCVIASNVAANLGGGMSNSGSNSGSSNPIITNSIFWNNAASAGRNLNLGFSLPTFTNCILPGTSFSDVAFSNTPPVDGGGNKFQDPKFVFVPQLASIPTDSGDYHVMMASPAINMGLNSANGLLTDLDGNARVLGSIIDIGAYEFVYPIDCNIYTNIVYVDSAAIGNNNGTSWANAFNDLQDALAVVRAGCIDTVKVAQGTYYPGDTAFVFDKCTGLPIDTILPDRSISFDIPDSVVVLGGYGHGIDSLNRDWECNKTILSGDINHDHSLNANTYHIVRFTYVSDQTVLDGFVITGGHADQFHPIDSRGAGVFNEGSGSGNRSNPLIRNCSIINNRARIEGGGIYNDGGTSGDASPSIINCMVSGNSVFFDGFGGAMADEGGGGNASPVCINSIFSGNFAKFGGAVSNNGVRGRSSPNFINCVFSSNRAASTDVGQGGAIYGDGDLSGSADPIISNCILWNNVASEGPVFYNSYRANPSVKFSIIQGSSSNINDASITFNLDLTGFTNAGAGNKFQGNGIDPLFINAPAGSAAPTASGNFHIIPGSPAINMGLNSANNFSSDIDGKNRIIDGTIDMGAYEFGEIIDCSLYTSVVYVDSSATGFNNGTSWANAFTDLQDALAVVRAGCVDTVKVAQGTYYPSDTTIIYDRCTGTPLDTTFPVRDVSFDIPDSAVILGGYGHRIDSLNRDWHCNKTILCGDIEKNGYHGNDNSYHVVYTKNVSPQTLIDGFCIIGGAADLEASFDTYSGGGWYNDGSGAGNISNPTIQHCIFIKNTAGYGAALYNKGDDGGNASPRIINCTFQGNSAFSDGGALFNDGKNGGNSSPVLINMIISGNKAVTGGGMRNNGNQGNSSPIITNVVINGNKADNGGAMYNIGSGGKSKPVITNSILWNNEAAMNGPVFYNSNAAPSVSYSFIQNKNIINDPLVTFGGGSVDAGNNYFQDNGSDPMFINPQLASAAPTTTGNFHVLSSSQAIDMGLNDSVHVTTDLDGDPRIKFNRVDIGAYENGNAIDCNLYSGLTTVYVDSAATGANNGTSWANAFNDFHDALAVVREGCLDTIKVAQGTYYPSDTIIIKNCSGTPIDTLLPDKGVSFDIPDSAVVLGGYGHGMGSMNRDFECYKTILCGDIDRDGTLTGNTYHVVSTTRVSEYTILDGFYITGGNAVSPVVDYTQLTGGGVYNSGIGGRCIPVLRNLIISGNNALSGGGMTNDGLAGLSSPTIINCIISGNTSSGGGAGVVNQGRFGISNPVFINCIISGNSSDYTGGGMYNNTGPGICKPVIFNSIFWNNYAKTSDSIIAQNDPYRDNGNIDTNFTIITHSILQPGHLPIYVDITDPSNKRSDPLFLSAPLYTAAPTNSGNFHVLSSSPAIDMGDNATPDLFITDLDGKMRIINSTVDIGAYEFGVGKDCSAYAGIKVIYVDSAAMGGNNGITWADAFNNLQDALAIVRSCGVDTVKVAKGTYYPSDTLITFKKCSSKPDTTLPNRNISFNIPDSAVVLGGYGYGSDTSIRNWECNKTILCGEIQQDGDSTNNSFHVVVTDVVSAATTVDGFYISDGNANGMSDNNNGGGWYNNGFGVDNSSNPTILNCAIIGNSASGYGGGLYNNGLSRGTSSPGLTGCIISGNNAYRGGGIYNDAIGGNSSPVMLNCIISGNTASNFGGGMASDGQYSGNSYPKMVNGVFNGNTAIYGGAVWNEGTCGNTYPDFTNCIFWNNTATNGPVFYNDYSSPSISYCLIQGLGLNDPSVTFGLANTNGGNNKFQLDGFNPQFLFAPAAGLSLAGDFHLKYTSSAIDMGLNSANTTLDDLDGNARIQNGTIDLGAYEFQGTNCSLYASKVLYVDSFAVAGLNNGASWTNAFTHLQDALAAAYICDIDTIKVARGTYYPSYPDTVITCSVASIIPVAQSDFFNIPDGVVLYGGYTGICAPANPDQRDVHCNVTVLSGDIDHDGTFSGNSYNVIKTIGYKDTITFDGFVIEWGDATPIFEEGGGWWDGTTADSAKLIIRNTIFRNNKAVFGGGFYGEGPRELMVNQTEFYNNTANCNGGGAYVNPLTSTAGDTAFIRFENVLWHQNKGCEGGALAGVAAVLPPDVIDIVNNTFSLNSPDAFNSNSNSIVRILNTIMWNDVVSEITGSNIPVVNNSLIQGGFAGINNKNADPLFKNPASDFRLSSSSPAVNMGNNTYAQDSIDFDGLPRISFLTVDMGAYESLLNCDTLLAFIGADGSGPFVPIDSLLGIKLDPKFSFYINGVLNNSGIAFNCSDTGINKVDLLITKPGCAGTDTLDHCIKVIKVTDTFPKNLTSLSDLNISLDANCMFLLTPYNLLSNFKGCSNDFEVHIQYPLGTNHNVPDNKLDRSHLGYCLVYSVVQKSTGNTTWGKLCVEDKYPPKVGDAVEYKTCFDFGRLPTGTYKVADNCSDSAVVTITGESFTDYGCDSPRYQGVVTRHLVVQDQWGNTNDFTKKIYILKVSLDSVVCPVYKSYECGTVLAKDAKGNPDPSVSGAPTVIVNGISSSLWPNSASCKLTVLYRDEKVDICGPGGFKILRTWIITDWCTLKEKECKQWIEVVDKKEPVVIEDQEMSPPFYSTDPHDCGAYVNIDTLKVDDCSKVKQNYSIEYLDEGQTRIIQGVLPVKHVWLPMGDHVVKVLLVDECKNTSKASFTIPVVDFSPPTPVCDEYTQVTVDPEHCWAAVAAKDLDNGSHDNCCGILHFAAAKMDSIIYWQGYWNTRLETEVGKENYWRYKSYYEAYIEEWINIYVFSDTVHFDECGTNQVVLRVYEACGVPRYDPHVWPCSNHTWFCYNTFNTARSDMNFNWFDPKGARSCNFRPALTSIALYVKRIDEYSDKGYFDPKFAGATQSQPCQLPFYFPAGSTKAVNPPGNYCSGRYYNDCMVNVLVDDKQAPTVDHLEDVTVYCDGAPDWADYPTCDDMYPPYPGELRDSKGIVHGYYGGSSQYDVHMGTGDHNDPQACDQNRGWAPIYCKNWLYLDSFDRGGQVNLSDYFEKPVLVDKKRPLDHTLKANEFTFTDNCRLDDASLTVTNNGTINGCGEGWISRTWTIKDKCGNAVSATQKIIVKHRSDFEVIFPADKKVTCDFLNRTDTSELGAGKPKLSDDDCEQLGVTYKDEIFTIVDSACYKIVRTWTIIDWCIYNPNQQKRYPDVIVNDILRANTTDRACVYRSLKDNNDGYMQYVQIIKVIDELKPQITNCSDQTICIDKDCATAVNIPLSGTDNCSDQIRFRADITRPDGTHDKRSDITAITGSGFTAGAYKIQVIAKDQCGNEDTCNFTLTIKDCKKPTPYCLNGIATVVMPGTGSVQVWAKDFDKGASDNCTDASKLKFSFTKNTADASKVLTCANITNGKEQPITVEVWVTDEAGNQDFCSTYILLQDNGDASKPGGACADTAALVANVTGKLLTEEKEGVEFANVGVQGMQGVPSIVTSTDGSYSFSSIPMNTDHVSIKALRDDNPMNGVSTLDLVLIQKHILGTEYLKSPYKMIAADVDNSNDISAIDLLELRKLILGLYDKLPNNTSWKFIPKSYTFSDPSNPWSYPTEDVLTDMSEKMIRDFVGVKIGDVNSSAAAHNLIGTEIRSGETGLIFEVQDQVFKAGDKVSVEFRSPNFKGVSGFQGTLSTSYEESSRKPQTTPSGAGGRNGIQTLKFESISSSSSLKVSQNNIGRRWEHEGMVTMSWNTNTSMDLKDNAALFTMHFTAQSAGRLSDVLRIGSQHTIAESYEGKGELGNLSIRFVGKDGKEVAGKSELYQNYPNPFDQRTVIGLNLAEGGRGTLKITDVTGRTIKTFERSWNRGYNEVWLDRRDILSSGVMLYCFESADFKSTRKMIFLNGN